MKRRILFVAVVCSMVATTATVSTAFGADDEYKLCADSFRQEGLPQGKVTKAVWRSNMFPDTIRVFLQDGEQDLDNEHGNWWLSNLQMGAALKYKDYDYRFVGGTDGHNGKHGGAILPDSLRWLWREGPSE